MIMEVIPMSDILILPVMIALAVGGYFLMGRLDHFLDARVTREEEETDDADGCGK